MEEKKELDLEIRIATIEDFDILTDISRICFPEQLKWRATKSHSRKCWDSIINSNNSELWICSIYGQVVGFIVFTINRDKYNKNLEKKRYSILDIFLMFISNPEGFFKSIVYKLKQRRLKKALDTESSTDDPQINIYKRIRKNLDKCVPWCGPIAVLPSMRGKGISMKMMEHCFQRAKSLGYHEIYSTVSKSNMMSRVMMAIVDFKLIDEVSCTMFYKKKLVINNDK